MAFTIGSPPQAWGKFEGDAPDVGLIRFTPTGVGKIELGACYFSLSPVHPHRRGENRLITVTVIFSSGSPPQAWGKWVLNAR